MKIIKFIKCVLKIGGILPVFTNGDPLFIARFVGVTKMFIVVFSSTYTTITLFVFGFVNIDDINQSIISFYQGFWFAMGSIIVHLSLWSQTKAIQNLLDNLENVVNIWKCPLPKESIVAQNLKEIMKRLTKT